MITTATENEYYEALLNRDSKYVGIFYVGVTTTSVFCISTCRARKPKRENVTFYTSLDDALRNGFRPCKICKPTEHAVEMPEKIRQAIELVQQSPKSKVSDQMLRTAGIGPDTVRRWFNKNYGLTFHAYQRMYRINNAYKELKDGRKTTDAAFDQGYESLSGFGYTYKKVLGVSPSGSKKKDVILINRVATPLGPMFIGATAKGICLLEFTDRRMLETEFRDLQRLLDAEILIGKNEHTVKLKKELSEYFEGTLKNFTVDIDAPGTDFQCQVWETLKQVAYGSTETYQGMADRLGKPKAVRAIGRANGYNRISIVVPCHRILGKDGSLTGYGGGLARKKWLLDFEAGH